MYIFWGQKSVCEKGAKLWRQNLWLQLVFLQTSVGILPLLDEAILVGNKQIWFITICKENKRMRVSKQMDIFDELEDLYLSMIHFTFEFFCKFTHCLPLKGIEMHVWLCREPLTTDFALCAENSISFLSSATTSVEFLPRWILYLSQTNSKVMKIDECNDF